MGDEKKTPEWTGIWAAEEFAAMHCGEFRYLVDREVWLRWDGRRWCDADKGDLVRAAEDTAKTIFALALEMPKEDRKEALEFAKKTAGRGGINAMIELGSAATCFVMKRAQFDQHPHLLNVTNGTLDLRTGELRPHAQADYLTTLTPINYNPAATCPRWDQFLREIFVTKTIEDDGSYRFRTDEELINFVHRGAGYSMTGYTREHAFFILHGVGRNGKGRFVKQLRMLLGDASRTSDFKTFTAIQSTSINSPALASLAGARLVTAGEPDEGVQLSESTIKSVTGEDEIEAMAKYEAPFRYTPAFKIWLHCNHKPSVKGTDEGIWSRPRMIPFNVRFDNYDGKGLDKRDTQLDEKLDAEVEGILAWGVRGAMEWFRVGLGMAPAVKEATEGYRSEQDMIGAFVDERLKVEHGAKMAASEMHSVYTTWCAANSIRHPFSPETLKAKLDGRPGIQYKRDKSGRWYVGVRVKTSGEQAADKGDSKQPSPNYLPGDIADAIGKARVTSPPPWPPPPWCKHPEAPWGNTPETRFYWSDPRAGGDNSVTSEAKLLLQRH